jgi:undecaprenyl-diphosphatase
LLGWQVEDLTFDIALHLGTLLAVLVYFFRDWMQIIAHGFGLNYGSDEELQRNRALLWLLTIGSIPVGVFGWLFSKQAETTWRDPFVIGGMMVSVGVLMGIAERLSRLKRDLAGVNLADAMAIGAAQAVAIVPGTSRSGITITAGLFRNMERRAAARFSFLLSTPAIAAAAAKAVHELSKQGHIDPRPFALGVAISALTGCAAIAWFLRFLQRRSLASFVYYRIIFGIIVIALALFRHPAG